MHWQFPTYLWAESIPGLLVCAWALSEWHLQRRLRAFCDPSVMGIVTPWRLRIAAVLVFASGLACAVAVLAVPMFPVEAADIQTPGIQFLLDQQSLDAAAGPFWDGLESSVQALTEQLPGSRSSFLIAGSPPRVLVHPTFDSKGLQIVVSSLRFAGPPADRPDLGEVLHKRAESQDSAGGHSQLAVISAAPADEIERMGISLRNGRDAIVFVHLRGDPAAPQYGFPAHDARWIWTQDPGAASRMLVTQKESAARRVALTQWTAIAAAILLAIEFLLAQNARRATGGNPSV